MNDVQDWIVACKASELKKTPKRMQLEGKHIVLFRDSMGAARALMDRCPFESAEEDLLKCAYHGWCVKGDGLSMQIPNLINGITHFETLEHAGLIFINLYRLKNKPKALDCLSKDQYASFITHQTIDADEVDILERALDPFLMFQNWKKKVVNVNVRISKDLMEADYFSYGNWLTKTTARFVFPNVFQLSYETRREDHLLITGFLTRRNSTHVDVWRIVQYKGFLPISLVKWALKNRMSISPNQNRTILEKENYLGFPLRHRLNGHDIKEHVYQVKRFMTKDWTFSLKRSLEKV